MTHRINLAVIFAIASGAVGAPPTYTVKELPGAGAQAGAFDVSSNAKAAGFSLLPVAEGSLFRASSWSPDPLVIEPLPGDTSSHAFAIDDTDRVTGVSFTTGELVPHAFRHTSAGVTTTLGDFLARGANNAGLVVGWAPVSLPSGWTARQACVRIGAGLVLLPGLGGNDSQASAVSGAGLIVGHATIPGELHTHATSWVSGVVHDLGTLGGTRSQALAVNSQLQAVGFADNASGHPHATIFWMNADGSIASRTDLGVLGSNASYAYGVNGAGHVVGTSDDRAFLWDGSQLIDLNDAIPPATGWHLQAASAINDDGTIVGWGLLDGFPSAFILTSGCPADVNGDGQLNILDFVAFQIFWQQEDPVADCDDNAAFNILDFVCFQGLFQEGCP